CPAGRARTIGQGQVTLKLALKGRVLPARAALKSSTPTSEKLASVYSAAVPALATTRPPALIGPTGLETEHSAKSRMMASAYSGSKFLFLGGSTQRSLTLS